MPTNYTTVKGDSLRGIAAKLYGDRSKAILIQGVNPGLNHAGPLPITTSTALVQGQVLIIPDSVDPSPSETAETQKTVSLFDTTPLVIGADSEDEVTITINRQSFKNFNGLNLKFDYDKLANEFAFAAPFDPDIQEYRDAFRAKFQPTAIYIGGKLVISGQSWANPNLAPNSNTVAVKGYSITGSLMKSALIAPFEFDEGTSLTAIAVDVCARFGFAVVVDSQAIAIAGKPFEKRVGFSPTENIGPKLATLVRERGLVLGTTFNGRVLISKPKTEAATVQAFVSGELPAGTFAPTFNPEALHTKYIGYAPDSPDEETEASDFTLDGFEQPGIVPRIKGIVPSDVDNQGLEDAVRGVRGRAFGEWFSLSVNVVGWRDRNNNIYQPNTLVTAKAPRGMLYEDTKLFVRAVTLNKVNNKKSAKLDLILPEALTGRDLKITV